MTDLCWVTGCDEPRKTKGLCKWHYERLQTYDDYACLAGPRPPRPHCEICGTTLRNLNSRMCVGCRPAPLYPRDWVNPLVCICAKPVADPTRDFGMCQVCKRIPVALMHGVKS